MPEKHKRYIAICGVVILVFAFSFILNKAINGEPNKVYKIPSINTEEKPINSKKSKEGRNKVVKMREEILRKATKRLSEEKQKENKYKEELIGLNKIFLNAKKQKEEKEKEIENIRNAVKHFKTKQGEAEENLRYSNEGILKLIKQQIQ